MNKLSFRLLCQICLLLVLLVATVLLSLPYSPLALILFLVMLFVTFRLLKPRLNVVILVAVIFLLALMLEPFVHYLVYTTQLPSRPLQLMMAMAIVPAIYLLDYELRKNAAGMTPAHGKGGRHGTSILRAVLVSVMAMLLVSLITKNGVLLFAGLILILYLLVTLLRVLRAIPKLPLHVPATWKRVVAGTTADVSLYATSKASMKLHCLLSAVNSWAEITPQRFTLTGAKIELNLTVTPPLAGPSYPQFQVSVIDPWGFIQVNQAIEPVELRVIPRARYAEWLAMRFLEQTGAGATVASTIPPESLLVPKRGIEYLDSRTYQPGDQLSAIDWKHTLKLNQLVIKEYIEAGEQTAIIAVNLSVSNAEEADKLAFNVITTALTLAREAIPTALVVYNHESVVVTTAVTDPREILKQTLLLVKDITAVEFPHRFLQLPDLAKLRRNITQLKQVTSEASQRLLGMLDFEYRAIEEAAKNHWATLALLQVTEQVRPPAMVVLLSQLNHDAEVVLVTAEKLTRRGFTTLSI